MTTFNSISTTDVEQLMIIENACHSHPWSESVFKSCIGGRYFGEYLTENDLTVGFYVGEYISGEATLMDICVSPEQQGKGFGKKLLNRFSELAKSQGAEQIFLEVRAKNLSAHMMYINYGFNEIGRRTGYYPSNTGYEDAIVMKKSL